MSTAVRIVAIVLSAVAGVGAGFAAYKYDPSKKLAPAAPPPPSKDEAKHDTPAPPLSASAVAVASESAVAIASSASAPHVDEDPATCLPSLFADGTFPSAPDLSMVCSESKAMTIAKRVKEAVVKASGGHVTGGMQEWAVLGIHEIAAVAVLRGRCCPSSPPLELPQSPGSCPHIEDVVAEIEYAARRGVPDAEIDNAVAHFDSTARCIVRSGDTAAFGGYTTLDGGETTTFQKLMHRAQGSASH